MVVFRFTFQTTLFSQILEEKSRIRLTLNLAMCADSNTNTNRSEKYIENKKKEGENHVYMTLVTCLVYVLSYAS